MKFLKSFSKTFFLALIFQLSPILAWSQQMAICGSTEYQDEIEQQNPQLKLDREASEIRLRNYIQAKSLRSNLIRIPVVVHLIGDIVVNQVTVSKVDEQIAILNEDFRKKAGTHGYGDGVDCNIEFFLATKDPNGYNTTGILPFPGNYQGYNNTSSSSQTIKNISHWPPQRYLNLYVADLCCSLGGFSTRPENLSGNPNADGVVIDPDHFGLTSGSYGLGRVCTHEVGHWLGLYHTFQKGTGNNEGPCLNSDCTVNGDLVCDTPPVWNFNNNNGANNNCVVGTNTCDSDSPDLPDLIHNYMDYTTDACRNMFTQGQLDRMNGILNNERFYANFEPWAPLCTEEKAYSDTGEPYTKTYCEPDGGENPPPPPVDDPPQPPQLCSGNGSLLNGFFINGKKDNIVTICINDDITIVNSTGIFCPATEVIQGGQKCRDTEDEAYFCYGTGCNCYYARLFIGVTLCDDNLIPAGEEYGKWQPFKEPTLVLSNELVSIPSFNLKNYLPSPYITFHSGQIYRIKIASTNYIGQWEEYTKYIRLDVVNQKDIYGATITQNIYANNITLTNSTVPQPIEVVASNSIRLLPNTNLKGGHYYIAPLNCSEISKSLQIPNLETTENSYEGVDDSSSIPANQLTNQDESIIIYPNPTDGNITIDLKQLTDISKITLTNNLGIDLLTKTVNEPITSLNLSEFPVGLYFIKIQLGEKVIIKKVVKR